MPLEPATPQVVIDPSVQDWLDLQQQVSQMNAEEVRLALEGRTPPQAGRQLFYYGLLRQHSQSYEGWMEARDTFRILHNDEAVTARQRQMAGLLEIYNQQRINWYQQYLQLQAGNEQLQRQLQEAEQEKTQLQQKIEALTELEAQISTRKDQ